MPLISIDAASVDWDLLRKQKAVLVNMTMNLDPCSENCNDLYGIVGLIDFLQDKAVGVLGYGEVFGP